MIVAVPVIGVMQMSLHEIVFVTAVRNFFVTAAGAVSMLAVMRPARMSRGA